MVLDPVVRAGLPQGCGSSYGATRSWSPGRINFKPSGMRKITINRIFYRTRPKKNHKYRYNHHIHVGENPFRVHGLRALDGTRTPSRRRRHVWRRRDPISWMSAPPVTGAAAPWFPGRLSPPPVARRPARLPPRPIRSRSWRAFSKFGSNSTAFLRAGGRLIVPAQVHQGQRQVVLDVWVVRIQIRGPHQVVQGPPRPPRGRAAAAPG